MNYVAVNAEGLGHVTSRNRHPRCAHGLEYLFFHNRDYFGIYKGASFCSEDDTGAISFGLSDRKNYLCANSKSVRMEKIFLAALGLLALAACQKDGLKQEPVLLSDTFQASLTGANDKDRISRERRSAGRIQRMGSRSARNSTGMDRRSRLNNQHSVA